MKNKVRLLFLLLILISSGMQAQVKKKISGAVISFPKTTYQLGSIKEEAGKVNIQFKFTNTGTSDLIISNVKAEKGIDIVSWPKNAIASGESGLIVADFNPKGNYYSVNKKITVLSNSVKKETILKVSGYVQPIPGSIAAKYKRDFNNTGLLITNTTANFGDVTNKANKKKTLEVYNSSDKSMKIALKKVPKYMKVSVTPTELQPKEKGEITVEYNGGLNKTSDGKQKWGAQSEHIFVIINDDIKNSNRNSITVRVNIIEDFENLSEAELSKAPKVEFPEKRYNFGTIKQGDVVTHDFAYTNNGESDLEIRHVKAS